MNDELRSKMVDLLQRIVGDQPLPPDLQRIALQMFAGLAPPAAPSGIVTPSASVSSKTSEVSLDMGIAVPFSANRRLVYVHGICRHVAGFSDPWWNALRPFVSSAFGEGAIGQTRLEVVWSDIVNQASANLAASAGIVGGEMGEIPMGAGDLTSGSPLGSLGAAAARQQAAAEIKESLRDRTDQHVLNTSMAGEEIAGAAGGFGGIPVAAADTSGLVSVPGLNCIDDFSIYLTNDGVRQQILNRFMAVVKPELQANRELDIISHSWGTVVAYEGLRQLEDEGVAAPKVRNLFTVGSALSIGPVKMRLRPANRNGRKPASVRRWVNLDARGDIIGGPLRGRPYAVDLDFLNLEPFGCGSLFGLVDPRCAHGSYFQAGNVTVNRHIFGGHINQP